MYNLNIKINEYYSSTPVRRILRSTKSFIDNLDILSLEMQIKEMKEFIDDAKSS